MTPDEVIDATVASATETAHLFAALMYALHMKGILTPEDIEEAKIAVQPALDQKIAAVLAGRK